MVNKTEGETVEEVEASPKETKASKAEAKKAAADEAAFYAEEDPETDGLILAERSKVDGTKHF